MPKKRSDLALSRNCRAKRSTSFKPFVTPFATWHDKDDLDAKEEGWLLSKRDDGFYEIQRHDENPKDITTDDKAAALVVDLATSGSRLHCKALCFLGRMNHRNACAMRAK